MKNLWLKGVSFMMKAMPVILPAMLILNCNSTASSVNGQPEAPASLRSYRKF